MIHFEVVGTQSNLIANPPSAVVRCRASGADSEQAAIDFALKATARIQWTARGTLYRGNPTAKAIEGNTWEIEFPYSVTADDQTQISQHGRHTMTPMSNEEIREHLRCLPKAA